MINKENENENKETDIGDGIIYLCLFLAALTFIFEAGKYRGEVVCLQSKMQDIKAMGQILENTKEVMEQRNKLLDDFLTAVEESNIKQTKTTEETNND